MFHGAGQDADCTFLFVAKKRPDIHLWNSTSHTEAPT
jgi:hypothetical protein